MWQFYTRPELILLTRCGGFKPSASGWMVQAITA
jgi:hypothetical protein